MVQSACFYHSLLKFESISKIGVNGSNFAGWIFGVNFDSFYNFWYFAALHGPILKKNWWPNWRFFDALNESGKIFDRYDPQNFWKTPEAGAKK